MATHIFTGPTIGQESVHSLFKDSLVHGPIQHGDLLRLNLTDGDIVLIIDGLYHNHPPIRHKEILRELSRNVTVVGAASMGALRAAELHPYGMQGCGSIFESYRSGSIDADDEVAVVHTQAPEWRILSEALVNIRHTLRLAQDRGVITSDQSAQILVLGSRLPYARRSWKAIARQAHEYGRELEAAVEQVRGIVAAEPQLTNLKYLDAVEAVAHVRALSEQDASALTPSWPEGWRSVHLEQWVQHYSGAAVEEQFVSCAAELDFQRLFDEDMPRRWRAWVLGTVSGHDDGSSNDVENRALLQAQGWGLDETTLKSGDFMAWLSAEERGRLTAREALLRVLVRSSQVAVDLTEPTTANRLLKSREERRREIAQCLALNENVARSSFTKHIDHLKQRVLRDYLVLIWHLPGHDTEEALDSAARDRGFFDTHEAIEALRHFFLRRYHTVSLPQHSD
ncbi:TfuA-like protein [Streptomyces sp. NPDC003006]